jgi:uncharacterized membrane protein YeaQ/YmgE (transglycosylase-associated protein family)
MPIVPAGCAGHGRGVRPGRPCAAVASWLFGLLGVSFGGWIGYLIAGFIGACILIAIGRAFKRA